MSQAEVLSVESEVGSESSPGDQPEIQAERAGSSLDCQLGAIACAGCPLLAVCAERKASAEDGDDEAEQPSAKDQLADPEVELVLAAPKPVESAEDVPVKEDIQDSPKPDRRQKIIIKDSPTEKEPKLEANSFDEKPIIELRPDKVASEISLRHVESVRYEPAESIGADQPVLTGDEAPEDSVGVASETIRTDAAVVAKPELVATDAHPEVVDAGPILDDTGPSASQSPPSPDQQILAEKHEATSTVGPVEASPGVDNLTTLLSPGEELREEGSPSVALPAIQPPVEPESRPVSPEDAPLALVHSENETVESLVEEVKSSWSPAGSTSPSPGHLIELPIVPTPTQPIESPSEIDMVDALMDDSPQDEHLLESFSIPPINIYSTEDDLVEQGVTPHIINESDVEQLEILPSSEDLELSEMVQGEEPQKFMPADKFNFEKSDPALDELRQEIEDIFQPPEGDLVANLEAEPEFDLEAGLGSKISIESDSYIQSGSDFESVIYFSNEEPLVDDLAPTAIAAECHIESESETDVDNTDLEPNDDVENPNSLLEINNSTYAAQDASLTSFFTTIARVGGLQAALASLALALALTQKQRSSAA